MTPRTNQSERHSVSSIRIEIIRIFVYNLTISKLMDFFYTFHAKRI